MKYINYKTRSGRLPTEFNNLSKTVLGWLNCFVTIDVMYAPCMAWIGSSTGFEVD